MKQVTGILVVASVTALSAIMSADPGRKVIIGQEQNLGLSPETINCNTERLGFDSIQKRWFLDQDSLTPFSDTCTCVIGSGTYADYYYKVYQTGRIVNEVLCYDMNFTRKKFEFIYEPCKDDIQREIRISYEPDGKKRSVTTFKGTNITGSMIYWDNERNRHRRKISRGPEPKP
jgi:hypothetical protein